MTDKAAHIKEFYTLDQLAEEIKINKQSIRKFIREGELKAHKVGTRLIITREDINAWLNKNNV